MSYKASKYIWKLKDKNTKLYNEFYSLSLQIYNNREIKQNLNEYFKPQMGFLHDPFLLPDMYKAVDRLRQAIEKKEKIIVYGDYDVDGITSITTLKNVLADLGTDIDYYIPDRISEGYGVNIKAVSQLVNNYDLLITVDCGITSIDETEFAMSNGLDVIITDHHLPIEQLPQAIAVVNPKRVDNVYPNDMLAGVGVIFKTCEALLTSLYNKSVAREKILRYIDVVAIGTVADIVPLVDENRTIVSVGLNQLNKKPSLIGLSELIKVSDIKNKEIVSSHISYRIAPRLNAGGRVGSAKDSLELLLSNTKDRAQELAILLDNQNEKRKNIEKRIEFEAIELIENNIDKHCNFIMLYKEDWHHGVLGIVASRLVERYYRPVLLFSKENEFIKGSGRSISGLHLQQLLTKFKDYFISYGGHAMAVGAKMKYENLQPLHKLLSGYVKTNCTAEDLIPKLDIDTIIDLPETSIENITEVNSLKPFGIGNKTPTFLLMGCEVVTVNMLAQNKHTKLVIKQFNRSIDCLFWQRNDLNIKVGDIVDIVGKLEKSYWRNKPVINLIGKDIRFNKINSFIDNRNTKIKDDYLNNLQDNLNSFAIVFYGYNYGKYTNYIKNDVRPVGREVILYYNNGSFNQVKSLLDTDCKHVIIYDLPIHTNKLYKVNMKEDICFHLVYNNNDSLEQLNSLNSLAINRETFAAFYRILKDNKKLQFELKINEGKDTKRNSIAKLTMLKIFAELGFLTWSIVDNYVVKYKFKSIIKKRDLSDSQAYNYYLSLIKTAREEHKLLLSPTNIFEKLYMRGTK